MVSKCANPACPTLFHYLREGKVFRVEMEVTPAAVPGNTPELPNGNKAPFLVKNRRPNRKVEHFWLCGPCSQTVSLIFDKDLGINVIPKPQMRAASATAAAS